MSRKSGSAWRCCGPAHKSNERRRCFDDSVESLKITVETSVTFGILAAQLTKAGRDPHVRVNDLWLAAQAIQRHFQLLTSNANDFADIPGLQMVVVKVP
jgi:predicted nucleic acid-binding protein